jgi:hypothetical protein
MNVDGQNGSTLPPDLLRGAIAAARARSEEAEAEAAEWQRRAGLAREEETLLSRLLVMTEASGERPDTSARVSTAKDSRVGASHEHTSPVPHPLQEAVIEQLTRAGRPLHVSEIEDALSVAGVKIPGAGSQANLISYLRRDSRIVRPSRGFYALANQGFSEMPAQTRSGRKRKPRRSAVTAR